MSGLEQLDRLRREVVERARMGVVAAREAAAAAERAGQAALAKERDAERLLLRAQQDFSKASDVLGLRAAELQLGHARADLSAQREARRQCERTHASARSALADRERTLLEAELGRRAVEGRLSQRAADVGRRTERKRDEEAEDAFRATRAR